MSLLKSKKETAEPYEGLARIYDFMMRHVNYHLWALYVVDVFQRFHFTPRTVLDLACGTGSLALELFRQGYEVSGADGSPAMLKMARDKAQAEEADIAFWETTLPAVGASGHFDAVVCLYDSINYLLDLEGIKRMLDNVYEIITPDAGYGKRGLFIFDICTEANSMNYFRDITECERGKGFSYVRHSVYHPQERLQTNEFEIQFRSRDTVIEKHTQRIYSLQEILDVIGASSFELLGAYSGFTFGKATERAERIHFVLR